MCIYAEILEQLKQLPDFRHLGLAIDGRVRCNQEVCVLCGSYTVDGGLKHALTLYGQIVVLLETIQMNVEVEIVMRPELLQLLPDKHAVGAQHNLAPPLEELCRQLSDVGIKHWLAPAD